MRWNAFDYILVYRKVEDEPPHMFEQYSILGQMKSICGTYTTLSAFGKETS